MEITKLPLTPLISLFGRNMHKPYSILFFHFLRSNHSNLMSYTSILLIPNQFQHVIQNALSNPNHHSLYFSNPNLNHFFLNLYQNHHDSTLNTTNLTSIQENKALVMKNIKVNFPTNRNLLVFLFFLGFSSLIPLGSHLESLKEKKITSHLAPPYLTRIFFSLPSLFFPFFSLFSSLFFLSWPSSPLLTKPNFLNLHFDPHNLPNCT